MFPDGRSRADSLKDASAEAKEVASLQMSFTEAWVAQATVLEALLIECSKILPSRGLFLRANALQMHAFSQRPIVDEKMFLPIDSGRKETKNTSDLRKGAILLMYQ